MSSELEHVKILIETDGSRLDFIWNAKDEVSKKKRGRGELPDVMTESEHQERRRSWRGTAGEVLTSAKLTKEEEAILKDRGQVDKFMKALHEFKFPWVQFAQSFKPSDVGVDPVHLANTFDSRSDVNGEELFDMKYRYWYVFELKRALAIKAFRADFDDDYLLYMGNGLNKLWMHLISWSSKEYRNMCKTIFGEVIDRYCGGGSRSMGDVIRGKASMLRCMRSDYVRLFEEEPRYIIWPLPDDVQEEYFEKK